MNQLWIYLNLIFIYSFKLPGNTTEDYTKSIDDNIMYYVIAGFTSLFLNYLAATCWDTAAERQTKRIRNLLFKSICYQEMAYFDKNTPGDLSSRITRYFLGSKNFFFLFTSYLHINLF